MFFSQLNSRWTNFEQDHRARVCAGGGRGSAPDSGRGVMDLVREALDNQIVDRNQRRLGKIDGILVDLATKSRHY
jgi:hypothetical protein